MKDRKNSLRQDLQDEQDGVLFEQLANGDAPFLLPFFFYPVHPVKIQCFS
jgi:hypothetical protein